MNSFPTHRTRLLQRFRRGPGAFGPNLQIPSPDLVELIGLCGFDFVLLDGEHGAALSQLPELLRACDAVGLPSLVRVPSHDRSVLLPPLELGATGLQVPFVNTAEQARAIVRETKFAPIGGRGMSGVSRAARYGFRNGPDYPRRANQSVMLVLQLETREAVENAEEIAAVPGVDLLFIGPADLAQSYGHRTDRITAPTVRVITGLLERLGRRVPVAVSVFDAADVRRWHRLGVRCFLTSSARPLRQAFEGWHAMLRRGLPAKGQS